MNIFSRKYEQLNFQSPTTAIISSLLSCVSSKWTILFFTMLLSSKGIRFLFSKWTLLFLFMLLSSKFLFFTEGSLVLFITWDSSLVVQRGERNTIRRRQTLFTVFIMFSVFYNQRVSETRSWKFYENCMLASTTVNFLMWKKCNPKKSTSL